MKPKNVRTEVPLAPYTTLHIGGPAEYFLDVQTEEELVVAIRWAKNKMLPMTIIGGGSNVLVSDSGIRGLVLHMEIGGVTYEDCGGDQVQVTVGSGVVLDELVRDTVEHSLWGLENLSAIPGNVGGMPVQNTGAYGVEAKDIIESVRAYDSETESTHVFDNGACAFTYRGSRFKRSGRDRYIVLSVTLNLKRGGARAVRRGELASHWDHAYVPTPREMREAIISIRAQKLPDWHVLYTAGSFFKNPIVPETVFSGLRDTYPEILGFPQRDGGVKLSLGWILDHILTMKGYRVGNVGLYEKQALVLINYGGATAHEVDVFADAIAETVLQKVGVAIEREVKSIG